MVYFRRDPSQAESGLALRVGGIYTKKAVITSLHDLKRRLLEPGKTIEVSEDDQLTSDKQLVVTLQVFTYDEDKVILNGKEFTVPPTVSTGQAVYQN